MRRMISGWAKSVVRRRQFLHLSSQLTSKKLVAHHLSATSLHHHHTCATPPSASPRLHTCLKAASRGLVLHGGNGSRQPVRVLHTSGRIYGQSSCSSTSCVSPIVKDVLEHWTQSLTAAQVPEASLAAQYIVAHVLGVARNQLQIPDTAVTMLTRKQMDEVERLMICRLERMPLQYILGEWDFHSITLKVAPPVFIPRPETEQLVELAITTLRELQAPKVLEFCCGSGAISLALLHSLPQVECVAVDQSNHAVRLTEANALKLELRERLSVVKGKVTMKERPPLPHASYDFMVSNPPYVLKKDLMDLPPEIMMYEDLRALDGGKDGLSVIKAVLHHAHHLLLPGRKLLLEVDSCHPYLLPAWLEKQNLDLKLVQIHQDLNKKDRYMEFVKNS